MVSLGVGKNMVRSIRFWVQTMDVAAPCQDRTLEPTSFGEAVFADHGFDPFLEDIRTLWLLPLECGRTPGLTRFLHGIIYYINGRMLS